MSGQFRGYCSRKTVHGIKRKTGENSCKTGMCGSGTGETYDDLSKAFFRVPPECGTGSYDKKTMVDNVSRKNAQNTFEELFEMGIIPIVNENDTVSTYEMQFGDNDSLSAIVASLVGADLLILLSDIDGLYTDDPRKNPKAELIPVVEKIDNRIENMAGDTVGSDVGTGGMTTKLTAARIATLSGADMIIANAKDVGVLHQIFEGKPVGTFFKANKNDDFYIADYVEESME